LSRDHLHRYDLWLLIKKEKSEDEDQGNTQKALLRFQATMLQADSNTAIPPYFELDRGDNSVPDLMATYKASALDSLASVKNYLSRLSPRNETSGYVYCSVILGQCKPFQLIVDKALSSIRNQDIGCLPKIA
jgi:hypothetical protein